MPSIPFQKAVIEIEKINGKPTNEEKLRLYGLFKIANGEEVPQPGMFALEAKYKYNSWKTLKEEYTTPEAAETAYVETVEELKTKYGFDASRTTKVDDTPIAADKLKRYEELTK